MTYGILKFVHILLFVYWLGADLGVFILARMVRRSDLSFEQRALLLRAAMIIDLLPRVAFVLMFPVGLHLGDAANLVEPPSAAYAIAWAVAVAWLILIRAIWKAGGDHGRQQRLNSMHTGLQVVLLVVVTALGVASLLGRGPFPADWLGAKVLLFGLIFFCAIMIDVRFRPIGPAFARLAQEGSKPDIESAISRAVNEAIVWVLATYALVAIIAFVGTVKPF